MAAASVVAPAKATVVSPSISLIGGVNSSAGISNGLIEESAGTTWNGYHVVNDTTGYCPWTVTGTGFGTVQGTVTLNGRSVNVLSWSSTSIKIDPSGALFNPTQPWNWSPVSTTLTIKTATGMQVSQAVKVAPAISGLAYGQCTFGAAYERKVLNPNWTVFSSPYNSPNINASWTPKVGDQLFWKWYATPSSTVLSQHTAVITYVSPPVTTVSGKQTTTTYTLKLYQWNLDSNNGIDTTETTTFSITKQANGQVVVTALPRFRTGSTFTAWTLIGYDR
jgi:hypothetical protein